MAFTDEQIEFMRADLKSNFAYTKIIEAAKKIIEAEGKNFEQEFEKWKHKRDNKSNWRYNPDE
jgi:hypothetical protein